MTADRSDDLLDLLRDEGYAAVEGPVRVGQMIRAVSGDSEQPLCSGYRVFPDGRKCQGCPDCQSNAELSDRKETNHAE